MMPGDAVDWRERKKRGTRNALRDAGLRLFIEKGYKATSLKDITDAADVSLRSFYQHFEMKEDLLLVEAREFFTDFIDILEGCPEGLSPLDCYFLTLDELEPRWVSRFVALDPPLAELYKLGEREPEVVARYRWMLVRSGDRVRRLFAQRLDVDPLDLEPVLYGGLSDTVFATAFFLSAIRDEPRNYFRVCEEVLVRLGRDLDPDGVDRRRRQATAKHAPTQAKQP